MIHTFYVADTSTYGFKMSADFTSRSLRAAITNANLNVSLETKLAHMIVADSLVLWLLPQAKP